MTIVLNLTASAEHKIHFFPQIQLLNTSFSHKRAYPLSKLQKTLHFIFAKYLYCTVFSYHLSLFLLSPHAILGNILSQLVFLSLAIFWLLPDMTISVIIAVQFFGK